MTPATPDIPEKPGLQDHVGQEDPSEYPVSLAPQAEPEGPAKLEEPAKLATLAKLAKLEEPAPPAELVLQEPPATPAIRVTRDPPHPLETPVLWDQ